MASKPNNDLWRLVESDTDHAKGIAFNMLFMVWRRKTLVGPYMRAVQIVRELATELPGGVGVCQVVEADAVPPEGDVRRAFVEILRLEPIKHFSVIHDEVGFKASAVRSITSGVYVLARAKCRHAVHSEVRTAARWHAKAQAELGRHETAAQIEEIVISLRAFHRERYP
jgi:hypothetical protein